MRPEVAARAVQRGAVVPHGDRAGLPAEAAGVVGAAFLHLHAQQELPFFLFGDVVLGREAAHEALLHIERGAPGLGVGARHRVGGHGRHAVHPMRQVAHVNRAQVFDATLHLDRQPFPHGVAVAEAGVAAHRRAFAAHQHRGHRRARLPSGIGVPAGCRGRRRFVGFEGQQRQLVAHLELLVAVHRVGHVLALAVGCAHLAETRSVGGHLLAGDVPLVAEHDDPALEPELAQELHHAGGVQVLRQVDSVDDGADARLQRFELELDAADGDRLVVDGAEAARHQLVFGADALRHLPPAGNPRHARIGHGAERPGARRRLVLLHALVALLEEFRDFGFQCLCHDRPLGVVVAPV